VKFYGHNCQAGYDGQCRDLSDGYCESGHSPMNSAFYWEMANPSVESQTDATGSESGDNETEKRRSDSAKEETAIDNLGHQGIE
jgi:hypothetical protein